jgi:hypothetical protein
MPGRITTGYPSFRPRRAPENYSRRWLRDPAIPCSLRGFGQLDHVHNPGNTGDGTSLQLFVDVASVDVEGLLPDVELGGKSAGW